MLLTSFIRGWDGEELGEREREVRGCEIVCVCECVCTRAHVWMQRKSRDGMRYVMHC